MTDRPDAPNPDAAGEPPRDRAHAALALPDLYRDRFHVHFPRQVHEACRLSGWSQPDVELLWPPLRNETTLRARDSPDFERVRADLGLREHPNLTWLHICDFLFRLRWTGTPTADLYVYGVVTGNAGRLTRYWIRNFRAELRDAGHHAVQALILHVEEKDPAADRRLCAADGIALWWRPVNLRRWKDDDIQDDSVSWIRDLLRDRGALGRPE